MCNSSGVKIKTLTIDNLVNTATMHAVFNVDGASIRLSSTNSGLRFQGKVLKTVYDDYVSTYGADNVWAGMIICPTDYLDGLTDFTHKELTDNDTQFNDCKAETWNNESTATESGFYGFNCVLGNILLKNTDRYFSARAYLAHIEQGITIYEYADYNKSKNARSAYQVAGLAKADGKPSEDDLMILNSYINKISIYEYDELEYKEADDTYFIKLENVMAKAMKLSDIGSFYHITVTVNGKTVSPQYGTYEFDMTEPSTIIISYYNVFEIVPTDIAVKLYA